MPFTKHIASHSIRGPSVVSVVRCRVSSSEEADIDLDQLWGMEDASLGMTSISCFLFIKL